MVKPANPGSHGKEKDKDNGRDIDRYLPPRRPWVAVSIPDAMTISQEIPLTDPRAVELLGHQFDIEGKMLSHKVPVLVEGTPTGVVLTVTYPELQVLYKTKELPPEDA
jgi:hypothetical protein